MATSDQIQSALDRSNALLEQLLFQIAGKYYDSDNNLITNGNGGRLETLEEVVKAAGAAISITAIQQSRSQAQLAFVQDSQWRGVTSATIDEQQADESLVTVIS